jgi:hypothetical protein
MAEQTRDAIARANLAEELALQQARYRAALGRVARPHELIEQLQGIPFTRGEEVVDAVTGLAGEVLGSGIENVEEREG